MKITIKKTFRSDRFIPICELSNLMCELTAISRNRKTIFFSKRHLDIIEKHGCKMEVIE